MTDRDEGLKDTIVQEAARLCVSEGVDAVTERRTADAAGTNTRTVGRLMSSMEGLVDAVTRHLAAGLPDAGRLGLSPASDLRTRVQVVVDDLLDGVATDPGRHLALVELRARSIRGDGMAARALHEALLGRLGDILDADLRARPAAVRVRLVASLLDGLVLDCIASGEDVDRKAITALIHAILEPDDGLAGALIRVTPAPWDDPRPVVPPPLRATADTDDD